LFFFCAQIGRQDVDDENWHTLGQLEDFFKSKEVAAMYITTAQSRLYKHSKALRDANVKEYKMIKDSSSTWKRKTIDATLETSADISNHDATGVAAAISDFNLIEPESGHRQKGRDRKKLKADDDTPEEPQPKPPKTKLQLKKEEADTRIRAVKVWYDKAWKELDEVRIVQKKLQTRSWSSAAKDYLGERAEEERKTASVLLEHWASAKTAFDEATTIEAYEKAAADLDAEHDKIKGTYLHFKTHVLGDFKKFK
jgi:hypothetical protein